jgi:hypothetical protein
MSDMETTVNELALLITGVLRALCSMCVLCTHIGTITSVCLYVGPLARPQVSAL